ncbi:tellurite resistance TerB family protein [Methyloceanibacter marginalis]|uniref:tellurite resistance TerB family protein n=1 Tax=Methyloceanibacter marginalis TaxID=1774971 RepID=UPI00114CC714|nr:tellurite resistance TerB family protein [Methyloceanibacter marginalis]
MTAKDPHAEWILKAMVAVAASDGRLDSREVGLIQQVYKDQSGRTLTADEIARAPATTPAATCSPSSPRPRRRSTRTPRKR